MLKKLFRKYTAPEPQLSQGRPYHVAMSGLRLLADTPCREAQLRQIKRLYSVTDAVWAKHYLFAIERFANYAQALPASENHHHAQAGGLLDHTLEALLAGARIAQGYMLPPNAEPEDLSSQGDKWRFGAFIAVLAHDIGKLVTDIEVVFRLTPASTFQNWHPWMGSLPQGCEYAYRFRSRADNAAVAKSLHEKAALSLLPTLLTQEAITWLFSDPELIAQLLSAINNAPFGGGAIAEIVHQADRASVSINMGAHANRDQATASATSTSASSLQEKLIVSLRKLITDGELRRNRPGAAIWVTGTDTWVVAKKGAEALIDYLLSEGHKGIPRSPLRIFNAFIDHGLVHPNPDGDPVWQALIEDYDRDWSQKLSFLRFDNDVLWPGGSGQPKKFGGNVVALDNGGTPLDEPLVEPETDSAPAIESAHSTENAEPMPPTPEPRQRAVDTPVVAPSPEPPVTRKIVFSENEVVEVQVRTPPLPSTPVFMLGNDKHNAPEESVAAKNDFLQWLEKEAGTRRLRVNEKDALVHVTDQYVAIVSPEAFVQYLKANPMRRKGYLAKGSDIELFKLVQRDLEAAGIHKSTNGQNITTLKVRGSNRQGELSCYLIEKKHLPFFRKFSPNKAIVV